MATGASYHWSVGSSGTLALTERDSPPVTSARLQVTCDGEECGAALTVPRVVKESARAFASRLQSLVDSLGWTEGTEGTDLCPECSVRR